MEDTYDDLSSRRTQKQPRISTSLISDLCTSKGQLLRLRDKHQEQAERLATKAKEAVVLSEKVQDLKAQRKVSQDAVTRAREAEKAAKGDCSGSSL